MNDVRRLPPETSQRLVDFARACRAAVRAVSLYPPGHRAVGDAVTRLTETARRAAGDGGLAIDVMPGQLRVNRLLPDRDDSSLRELAAMLHAQQIGGVTLHGNADRESWRTLLGLMIRSPEDNRRDGGLAALWKTAGGPSLELHAIDYAALLREGFGGSLTRLLHAAHDGALANVSLDDLEAIIAAIEAERAAGALPEDNDEAAGRALARLASLVLERGAGTQPERVDSAFKRLADLAERLSTKGMCGLLAARGAGEPAPDGDADAIGAHRLLAHLDAPAKSRFVAMALAADGSASARLREAFEALVASDERRRVAAMAADSLASAGAPPAEMPRLLHELDTLVTVVQYDDSPFVGSAYARELTAARGRAEDLETAKPDPAERIEQWVSTVSDTALRGLDLQVLMDLLAVDENPSQFSIIAQQAAGRIEEFVRVGLIEPALALEGALEAAREAGGARGDAAESALARLQSGALLRDLMPLVRRGSPDVIERVTALLSRLGPAIAPPLAHALAQESDPAVRGRLRSVLAGFGDAGEQAIRALLSSENAETRRNAALLLRDFRGAASVDVLEQLLGDRDIRVRREALRALAVVDDPQAHDRIVRTLKSVPAEAQRALLDELTLVRDPRISPLLALIAMRWREGRLSEPAIRAIDMLGSLGSAVSRDAIDALSRLIEATRWWSPFRARTVREHAAGALAAAGTPDAWAALEQAATRRGKGASHARHALARKPA